MGKFYVDKRTGFGLLIIYLFCTYCLQKVFKTWQMHKTMMRQAYLEMPPSDQGVYYGLCDHHPGCPDGDCVPLQLYFNPLLILRQYQVWRLVTTFLFLELLGSTSCST
eukprot:TRINITY_DN30188_c0_g1_i1.p1 TRINITY_DN30188_c0_g1~~TRINITY_DN30188_c0_g1_i1.p1  ORF type:complete len:116 (+),score=19.67 TRINITY_DN30188_c0_g1_i1:25-348(+)